MDKTIAELLAELDDSALLDAVNQALAARRNVTPEQQAEAEATAEYALYFPTEGRRR